MQEARKINVSNIVNILCILIFIICILLKFSVFQFRSKYNLHVDDIQSLSYIKNNSEFWVPVGKEFSGLEIKLKYYLLKNFSHKEAFKRLYLNNSGDSGQSNFYYFILLFLSYFIFITDVNILHIIFAMNLLIFPISYYFMYKILKLLYPSAKYLIPAGLFLTFINPVMLCSSVFRIYDFQLFSIIFLIYVYLDFTLNKNENYYKLILAMFLAIYISYLGGLFSVFVLLSIIAYRLIPYINKISDAIKRSFSEDSVQKRKLTKIFAVYISSLLLTILFFPTYFAAFTSGWRMKGFREHFSLINGISRTFGIICSFFSKFLFFKIFIISLFVLSIVFFIKKRNNFRLPIIFLFISTLSILFILNLVLSYFWNRYLLFMVPILTLMLLELLYSINNRFYSALVLLILVLSSFNFSYGEALNYYGFGKTDTQEELLNIPTIYLLKNSGNDDWALAITLTDINDENRYIVYYIDYFINNRETILNKYKHCRICNSQKKCIEYNGGDISSKEIEDIINFESD